MQEIPLSASPSLPNFINSHLDPSALIANPDPPHISLITNSDPPHISPRPPSPKNNSAQTTILLQNSHLSLRKNDKPPIESNRSMPQLCLYPKTRKFSEFQVNSKILDHKSNSQNHEIKLTKSPFTSSLPALPSLKPLNLPLYPLRPNPNNENNMNPLIQIPVPEEKFCKICFETAETKASGKLISPCKCTGTVRFIHEECLKTWQVSQKKDIRHAECELCHCRYVMNFRMGLRCYPRQAIDDGLLSFISSLCLFVLIATLISIIVIFSLQLYNQLLFQREI